MDAAKNACTLDIVLNLYRSGLLSSFSVAKSEWNEGIIFLPECGNSNDLNKAALTRVFAFFLFHLQLWILACANSLKQGKRA